MICPAKYSVLWVQIMNEIAIHFFVSGSVVRLCFVRDANDTIEKFSYLPFFSVIQISIDQK